MFRRLFHVALAVWPFACSAATDAERQQQIDEMYDGYAVAFQGVPSISASDLKRRLETGEEVVLVDVRPLEERRVAILPGAIASESLQDARDRQKTVVVYCTIGARSGAYAKELQKRGYAEVLNLEGSLLSWTHVGGELVDLEGNPTKQVHVYGKKWNLVAEGYEGVVTKGEAVVPLGR